MIKTIKNRLFSQKSDYLKSVLTLMTGTAVAQFIPLAVTPILTRLYSPEEFGVLALYLSSVSVLSIFVTCNYEKAIIMPKNERDAIGIIKLTIFLMTVGCILILLVGWIFNKSITSFYGTDNIRNLLYFIPLSVFSLALYNVINTWFNRIKEYKKLSYNRVAKSSISSIFGIGLGFAKFSSLGLVLGEFFGQFLATGLFSIFFFRKNGKEYKNISTSEIKGLAGTYKNFPIYTLPADMLSMASYQLPIFVFAKIFSQTIVGYYSLCIRVLDKPFVLLASSVYEVFRQKAMEDYNNYGNCLNVFKKTFLRLVLIGVPTMTVLCIVSPWVFKFVFGAEWEIAGHYARIISIMYFFKFVASPLSFTFYIANKQRLDLILHVYVFASSALILSVCYYNSFSVTNTLLSFVLNYSVVYLFYLFKSYQFAHGESR